MRRRQKRRVSRTTEGEADWAIAALHVPEIQTSPAISRLIHALPSPPSPAVAPLALAPPPHKLARVSLSLLSSFCEKGDICSQVFLSENQGI